MKKKNGLLYGAIALVVLCVIYIAVGQYTDRSKEKKEQAKADSKIYMTDISDIASISFNNEENELTFHKDDDTWKYDSDDLFPVKQTSLDTLAKTAGKLEAVRKLEDGDELSAYGFNDPIRTVKVTAEDGTETIILLGNQTEDGSYYAMIAGETTPYQISSSLYTETNYSLDDLMELEKFPAVAGTDITGVTITKGGESEHYVKKTLDEENDIAWYRDSADSEDNMMDDNSALNVLADSLSSLTVKNCVNYKVTDSELKEYGLDQPSAIISYTYTKNGEEGTFTLNLGSLNEDGSSYFTKTEGTSNVNEIEKESIDKCLTVNEEALDH